MLQLQHKEPVANLLATEITVKLVLNQLYVKHNATVTHTEVLSHMGVSFTHFGCIKSILGFLCQRHTDRDLW
jgi:hypothetical protein